MLHVGVLLDAQSRVHVNAELPGATDNVLVVEAEDPTEMVRRGYDLLPERYEQAFAADDKYQSWIAELCERLPTQAAVLDIGCGCGNRSLGI